MIFRLRAARPEDSELLFVLHRDAMKDVVSIVFGEWDDALQRELHNKWFHHGRAEVIETDEGNIGMIDVDWGANQVEIHRIEVDAAHRGHGLGTQVLSSVLAEADRRGHSTSLEVFHVNRARDLYGRLGFHEVSRHDTKIQIVRPAPM